MAATAVSTLTVAYFIAFAVCIRPVIPSKFSDFLLEPYRQDKRPVTNLEDSIEVLLDLTVIGVESVDMKKGHLITQWSLNLEWTDAFLHWNTSLHNGIDRVLMPTEQVWFPDISVLNAVGPTIDIGQKDTPVQVFCSGRVLYSVSKPMTTGCHLNVLKYPFDSQTCSINIGLWYSSDSVVTLRAVPAQTYDEYLHPNGQFHVISGKVAYRRTVFKHQNFTVLEYPLKLYRRWLFQFVNVILPAVTISFLNTLAFAIPHGNDAKVTLCVSLFLALVVLLQSVTGSLPEAWDTIPLLSVYVMIQFVCSALTMVVSVLSVRVVTLRKNSDKLGKEKRRNQTIWSCKIARPMDTGVPQDIDGDTNSGRSDVIDDEFSKAESMAGVIKGSQISQNGFDRCMLGLSLTFQCLLLITMVLCVLYVEEDQSIIGQPIQATKALG